MSDHAVGAAGKTTPSQQRRASIGMLILLLTGVVLLPRHSAAADDDQWIALTLARDGAWGMAMHTSRAKAVSLAIANCRRMAGRVNDCGSLHTSVRGAWSLAMLCGDYNVVVTAPTLAEAQAAARYRQIDLRASYAADLPACVHVVTVNPSGQVTIGEAVN